MISSANIYIAGRSKKKEQEKDKATFKSPNNKQDFGHTPSRRTAKHVKQ